MTYDAVILDVVMPVMDGYQFMRAIKLLNGFESLPILVTTEGNHLMKSEIKMLELGAWDFISKPYHPDVLKLRIKNVMERSQVILLQHIKYRSEHDMLTGLYSKTKFFESLGKMLAAKPEGDFACVRFDIDRFQLFNSFFGQEEGSRLLKFVADNLLSMKNIFANYCCGRIEGDVFGFCVEAGEPLVKKIMESLKQQIATFNKSYNIVLSFGVYMIDNKNISVNEIFDRAVLAARQCKGSYTNYYSFYNDKLRDNLIFEQEVMNEIDTAIAERQFEIYLQPIVDLKTEMPVRAEALIRWRHPKGLRLPAEFIPICERSGLISSLDYYVWATAFQLLKKWIEEDIAPMTITVNCSRVNAHNLHICDTLNELVQRYGVDSSLIELEITETAYMDDPVTMKEAVIKLQQQGFAVLMDDFGCGYSSLNVLRDIAFNVLKFDMEFLKKADTDHKSRIILSSLADMVRKIGIPIVAEGVETEKQLRFLRSIGCDYAQGYYFYKPMPVEEFERVVMKR